jgi:hypothetical protein
LKRLKPFGFYPILIVYGIVNLVPYFLYLKTERDMSFNGAVSFQRWIECGREWKILDAVSGDVSIGPLLSRNR